MINLLPETVIRQNLADYRRRRLTVAGSLLLAVWLLTVLLLGSLLASVWLRQASLTTEIDQGQLGQAGDDQMSLALQKLDQQVDLLFGQVAPTPVNLTSFLRQLLQYKTERLRLTSFKYERLSEKEARLQVSGLADLRQDFLDFVQNLRRDPVFTSVESPISNLIKDREVDFTVSLQSKL